MRVVQGGQDLVVFAPVLARKPRVLTHYVLGARKINLLLVALLILSPFILIPLVDTLLASIFSPVTEKQLFGLIKAQKEHPYLYDAQIASHWIIWILVALSLLLISLMRIPQTISQAEAAASDKEKRADALLEQNPSESVLLYHDALAWSIDEAHEEVLRTKLQTLDRKLTQAGDGATIVAKTQFAGAADTMVAPGTDMTEESGLIDNRYRIRRQLGSGAMGIVYEAEDVRLKRDVALKQLSPQLAADTQLLSRFRQEAHALARLSHPNIVQVYDFVEWDNHYFIAMEFIKGVELESLFINEQPLDFSKAMTIARQIANALDYVHEQGVVHRDLKPSNVLLTEKGEVKLTDFGIAKVTQSSLMTQVNTIMGSPAYMSPEQAGGETSDHRVDIYALGIILYKMVSGSLPFKGDAKSILAQHLTREPPDLIEIGIQVSPEFNAMIMKMLAKNPEDRYQSMKEVVAQIKEA